MATRATWIRIPLMVLGSFFVGLGIIGIVVPVLPTTPFLLLAAVCYARSSPRCHRWLVNNKVFGSYIKNYLEGKGIPPRAKVLIISLLWVTIGASVAFAVESLAIILILVLIAAGVSAYILSIRPGKPQQNPQISPQSDVMRQNPRSRRSKPPS